jgi:predicted secreted Zn-dependent protease
MSSIRANGPRGFHGLASWDISYEYTTKQHRDACQVATARTKVSGEILMPQWDDEPTAPRELQRRWSNYYSVLKRHEDGHIQHGKELALLVNERLMGLGVVPCDQLQALTEGEFQRLYGNLKARDEEYDARTNHGVTQGLVF